MTKEQVTAPGRPKVLLVVTKEWIATARLLMSLVEFGFEVAAVCRARHPLRLTKLARQCFLYRATLGTRSIDRAISEYRPDLILCCDEPALALLHRLHATGDVARRRLIEYSIGPPTSFPTVLARTRLVKVAQEEGLGTAATRLVESENELQACMTELGLPLVLKSDATSGGNGVRVVWRAKDGAKIWKRLRGPSSLLRTINRVIRDRDRSPVVGYFLRQTRVVSAQRYIANDDGTSASEGNMGVLCWRGKVVGCICFRVVTTWRARGPSSVLRVVDDPEMLGAAQKIARRLELNGFFGFDFIFDPVTVRPLLLEMNPRPTQVAHLALGPGKDLVAALFRSVTGIERADRPAVTQLDLIALFPQEWQRDRQSPMLQGEAFHDIPVEQPELVRAGHRRSP
jgi:glutathione synthase/RimK-type ligase-like ATP-grasp enzyme